MAVPTAITDLSATAASNSPGGSDQVFTDLDNFLRAHAAFIRQGDTKASDAASAATVDLGAVVGRFVDITGTTTITSFGTVAAGVWRVIRFTGALTLTHNGTSLILPTGANIATAAGDACIALSLGSGNWVVLLYQVKAGYMTFAGGTLTGALTLSGAPTVDLHAATKKYVDDNLPAAASETVAGKVELATSAEVQTGTDTARAVTPAGLAAGKIVFASAQATTSGTTVDFTGIPIWASRVTVMLYNVSTGGASDLLVRLYDTDWVTSGYVSASGLIYGANSCVQSSSTAGFNIFDNDAGETLTGALTLTRYGSTNRWHASGSFVRSGSGTVTVAGTVVLGSELAMLRLTSVSGDTFDNGSACIAWE